MKNVWVLGLSLLLLLVVPAALFGCKEEVSNAGELRFAYGTKPDAAADYERAREAWGWFFTEELPAGEENITQGGQNFYEVVHDQIKTEKDLKTYLGFLFSEDIVKLMLEDSPYRDIDSKLWVLPGERSDEIKTRTVSGAAVKEGNDYRYTAAVEVLDPYDESKVYETRNVDFRYEKVDGHWLFTSFPEPSGPNRIKQAELRTVDGSMEDIKVLLRATIKAFQRQRYEELMPYIRDDAVHDLSTLSSYQTMVTELFGPDAWDNASYTISDLTEKGDEWNTCKVALRFNGKDSSPIGYRDFYFYITDQHGPWTLSDICSFSFDPYFGGQKVPAYFIAAEAKYRGITAHTTEAQLVEKLGKPLEISEGADERSIAYIYGDAEYRFYREKPKDDSVRQLGEIVVYAGEWETIRKIRLGDSLETVVKLFPREKDYYMEQEGLLFGESTLTGQGGYLQDDLMIVTSEEIAPAVKIEFLNGNVNRVYYIMFRNN